MIVNLYYGVFLVPCSSINESITLLVYDKREQTDFFSTSLDLVYTLISMAEKQYGCAIRGLQAVGNSTFLVNITQSFFLQ